VYLVIQKFKTVTCDPIEVTSSWTGTDLCSTASYKEFFCEHPPGVKDRTIASVDFNGYRLQLASLKGFVYRECTALYPLLKDVFIQAQDLVATQPWSIGTTMNRLSSPPPPLKLDRKSSKTCPGNPFVIVDDQIW
jgi:hypothetical protein